ncbi:hypothetical protein QI345_13075 [Staphylococcus saprophyticus]|nr:hypothetical protein [Staphylococcus saprophyticus]
MIIEQLKQELELNTVNSIEVYFHSGDSVSARKIDYSQSSEKIIKVLNPVPMYINLENVTYIQLREM